MGEQRPDDLQIGVDEWVARAEDRIERRPGVAGALDRAWASVPPAARLLIVVGAAAGFGGATSNEYYLRVGFNTLLYALLAVGLNVVVGWAGLLDLGYVAFYGFGAYSYAFLSSRQFDVHWPALASLPLIVVACALLGLVVGLPSRRLVGDYLAIVTLFFGQIFYVLVNNADRITLPGKSGPTDITGGPNGIADVDNISVLGLHVTTVQGYYYLALVIFTFVVTALWLLNNSRTGRAWRSLREDPLAAQLLGMPINPLKLMAFAFGAAVAGLTGTLFAALQTGVFPNNFYLDLLITVYAMVILGGAGSLAGVVLGAIAINVTLEILRTPGNARELFYVLISLALLKWLRPWRVLAAVVAATIGLGFAVHAIVTATWPSGTHPSPTGAQSQTMKAWVVELTSPDRIGSFAYVALIAAVLGLVLAGRRARTVALVPLIYLASFVWENKLVLNPSVTRLIFLGALLVALMNVRPQGLLGTTRVEIA
jgi:ABC-type branched-subunit amino acid transport system permease subunit